MEVPGAGIGNALAEEGLCGGGDGGVVAGEGVLDCEVEPCAERKGISGWVCG